MSKVVAPIVATVEFITAEKSGEYGPYRSVLFKTPDDEKIWKSFDPTSEELTLLRKGVRVQLIPAGERHGKTSHNIVLLDEATAPAPATAPSAPIVEPEQAYEAMLRTVAARYSRAIAGAKYIARKDLGMDDETIAARPELVEDIASTLFIEVNRSIRRN
jgi:hypothetical protein